MERKKIYIFQPAGPSGFQTLHLAQLSTLFPFELDSAYFPEAGEEKTDF